MPSYAVRGYAITIGILVSMVRIHLVLFSTIVQLVEHSTLFSAGLLALLKRRLGHGFPLHLEVFRSLPLKNPDAVYSSSTLALYRLACAKLMTPEAADYRLLCQTTWGIPMSLVQGRIPPVGGCMLIRHKQGWAFLESGWHCCRCLLLCKAQQVLLQHSVSRLL